VAGCVFFIVVAARTGTRLKGCALRRQAGINAMPRTRSRPADAEISEVEEQIAQLENKLRALGDSVQRNGSRASRNVDDFVNDALEAIMERVRERTAAVTDDVTERGARAGTAALQRMVKEVEHYPLATLAVAAGIGFLLGSTRR
jgi:ElaB/YqjD/DUF883 family membrane-anchored ribosome-binding protein